MVGLIRRRKRLVGDQRGASAVEFALFAPFLFFAGVGMIDVGLAIGERMALDRMLRGGAQSAMNDPGADTVRAVIEASAPEDLTPGTDFTLSVQRVCACPGASDVIIACTTVCGGSIAPAAYYQMAAERTYPGILLPDIGLTTSSEVQVR